jgi:hypothetical protein
MFLAGFFHTFMFLSKDDRRAEKELWCSELERSRMEAQLPQS